MIAPSDVVVKYQWDVRFSTSVEKGKPVRSIIGRGRILHIETHSLPVIKVNDDGCDDNNKIFIVIRKLPKKNTSLETIDLDFHSFKHSNHGNHGSPYDDGDSSNSDDNDSIVKELNKRNKSAKYILDLFDLVIKDMDLDEGSDQPAKSSPCNVTIYHEGKREERVIIFADQYERDDFCAKISFYKKSSVDLQRKRFEKIVVRDEFKKYVKEYGVPEDFDGFSKTELKFLIEIVGAEDLKKDNTYVEVRLLDKLVHKTSVIKHQFDPVWTLLTNSYFILTVDAWKLLRCNDGIHFIVYDSKFSKRDKILGATCIPILSLLTQAGTRNELKLQPYIMGDRTEGHYKGSISIKCRMATDHDKSFIEKYEKRLEDGELVPRTHVSTAVKGSSSIRGMVQTRVRGSFIGDEKVKNNRIRPYPDPARRESTKWMTSEDIETESMNPSSVWIRTGSGPLARIYLEILQCNNLPNTDIGHGIERNLSDPFVQIVYEDATRRTDTINDCLSPRWLPWTQRAFVLHMIHPSSQISLGVFGSQILSHEYLGKVSVDITQFRPQTEYVLDYDLFDTHMNKVKNLLDYDLFDTHMNKVKNPKDIGTIKIRLRIEVNDHRAMALASLTPPPVLYINTTEEKHFNTVSSTIIGATNLNEFKIEHIMALLSEIIGYLECKEYIIVAFENLIMWHCTHHLEISLPRFLGYFLRSFEKDSALQRSLKFTIPLPLDSIIMFICATSLVENIALLPSYFFFFCGWTLTAVLRWRQNHPDPWCHCIGFLESLSALVTGTQLRLAHNITPDEKRKESIDQFNKVWEKRFESARNRKEIWAERMKKQRDEIADEMEEFGQYTDLTSQTTGKLFSLNTLNPKYHAVQLLKSHVYPYQQHIIFACEWLRTARNVITWHEYYFSFYLSVACFIIAAIFFFIPWAFITKWVARIVVWSLFGPWINILKSFKAKTKEFEHKRWKESKNKLVKKARILHEEAAKKRSFKQYLFGRFMIKIPIIKTDVFIQRPLPSSTATALDQRGSFSIGDIVVMEEAKVKYTDVGQRVTGDMIPKLTKFRYTDAVNGQALTQRQSMLLKKDILGNIFGESVIHHAAKISMIIILAGTLTWVCVPMLIGC